MPNTGFEQLKSDTFFRKMDYWMLVPILSVALIGLYVLNRVLSSGFGDLYPMNIYKQSGAVLVGLIIAIILSLLEAPTLRLVGWSVYGVSLLLLVYVMVDGYSLSDQWGADSWMLLPVVGSFQPSELAKVGLAMVSAQVFEAMNKEKFNWWQGGLLLLAVYAPPVLLIMRQPDFGTTMVILFMFVCMVFAWGIKWRYVLLGMSAAVIAVPLAWFFYLGDFQKNRIITFIFPGHDPDASFNLIQAQRAIASGGLFGNRSGNSVHVPVKESDFIYTAVSEHMGFIGTTALLILAFFFLARSLYVASSLSMERPSAAYTMVGLTAAMAIHYIENLGMCVGLLPITGIPLPFVSLGGTAMIVNFISLGVMLNLSVERNILQKE
ncbi:MAG: FtsW/RodA/SpoVE family cell cycle protein [Eubacteriales bacterium]|jgi:rod shape determining protein RodA|nr:FtsW/RodA/SpoVE family cell cycle protein [Eubacteriales bacterium]MDD3196915.1 FtsW/RodA/SpoVE family cell cycle protein [Eubacteriales bacterium]MDD3503335.1 FtsW/RodA/SpoVE family cell cycle protein [Eubacteriales bacterium]MDD4682214.1 FtsW/RodA/SpoVE family cell cycle protein [Eubacteriales bacterium]